MELNRKGDLTFAELSKLSSTMPEFNDLWISGGEPFLRNDLSEVIELFYQNNKIRDVRIPTNALPKLQILAAVERILHSCPDLQLEIDLSIDGFAETHDRIRGVSGNFEMALETLASLQTIRGLWPNLTIYINSVITSENQNEVTQLGEYFKKTADIDGHYFQIIRGNPTDKNLQGVPSSALKEIYSEALPLNVEYLSKAQRKKSRLGRIRRAYWKVGYDFTYKTQYMNYAHGAPWKMRCTAGQTSIVIDYNGDVRVCELRKPIDNLRKHGMDFGRFWSSMERSLEVKSVDTDKCFCTHICFMYDSMRHSKRVMLWELPLLNAKRLFQSLFNNKPFKPTPVRSDETVVTPVIIETRLPQRDIA